MVTHYVSNVYASNNRNHQTTKLLIIVRKIHIQLFVIYAMSVKYMYLHCEQAYTITKENPQTLSHDFGRLHLELE